MNSWYYSDRQEVGFNKDIGGEYDYNVPVVRKTGKRDSLDFLELIDYVNELEALAWEVIKEKRAMHREMAIRNLKDFLERESK